MVIASCLCFVWCFVDPKLNKLSPNATSTVLWVNFVVLLTHFVAPEGKFFNETTTQQHSSQTWSIPKWIIFGRLRQFPVKHYKGKQLSRKAIRNNPNVRKNKGKWPAFFKKLEKYKSCRQETYFGKVILLLLLPHVNTWVPCGPAVF